LIDQVSEPEWLVEPNTPVGTPAPQPSEGTREPWKSSFKEAWKERAADAGLKPGATVKRGHHRRDEGADFVSHPLGTDLRSVFIAFKPS
jgi:hypothetical protein